MVWYVLLCDVMLCYVMLCYVMLCYLMSLHVMLCYLMSFHVMLCYVRLFYGMLCCVLIQVKADPKAPAKAVVVPAVPASWFFLDHFCSYDLVLFFPLSPKTWSIF